MQVRLTFNNISKAKALLEYIKTLDFVTVSQVDTITDVQIEETRRRLHLIEQGEIGVRSWEEAKKDIFKK